MSRLSATEARQASWTAMLLVVVTLETVIASCTDSNDDVSPREADTDASSNSPTNAASDAACKPDSEVCATTPEPACSDVDWCPVETSHPIGLPLSSVWGSGKNDVWIIGARGGVSHWDGVAWTFVPVPTGWSLRAIWGSGPNDVWTATSSPDVLYHTTGFDNGTAQWSPVPYTNDFGAIAGYVRAIWGTGPGDVWVAGEFFRPYGYYPFNPVWRSSGVDGGATWALMSAFPYSEIPAIKSIWGSGPGDIWIVGATNRDQPLTFAAHTNGVAAADGVIPIWTEFDMPSIAVLYAVWGSGSGDVWAVGDYGTIEHFTTEAAAWSVVDSPTTENLRGLWGSRADDVWAVGEHGTLLHYDGTAWKTSTAAFPLGEEPNLYGVWGSGDSDVWAVGGKIVLHFSGPKSGGQGKIQ